MELPNISSFLEKYKKLPSPKRTLREAVEEFFGTTKMIKDVSYKNGVVYVKTQSVLKQEVFLNKKKLLAFLKEKNLGILINDIR